MTVPITRKGSPQSGGVPPVDPPEDARRTAPPSGGRGHRVRDLIDRNSSLWTFGVLLVIVLVFSVTTDNFATQQGWQAMSVSGTEVMLLAIGQTYVIVAGGIDLSVGAVLGFSGMMSALVMSKMLEAGVSDVRIMLVGLIVALAVGGLFGAINGIVITRFSVTPFIVTLGTMGVAMGGTQLANGGQEISELPERLPELGNKVLAGGWIPVPVAVVAVVAVVAALYLSKTRYGRRTQAIGSNIQAAARTGINVNRHLVRTYALAGLLAGLAGYVAMSQLGVATVTAGQGTELAAIAAVVIGGASLTGGRGSIAGTVIGASIVAVLETGLIIAKTNAAWQLIAVGVILIGAVLADQQRVRATRSA